MKDKRKLAIYAVLLVAFFAVSAIIWQGCSPPPVTREPLDEPEFLALTDQGGFEVLGLIQARACVSGSCAFASQTVDGYQLDYRWRDVDEPGERANVSDLVDWVRANKNCGPDHVCYVTLTVWGTNYGCSNPPACLTGPCASTTTHCVQNPAS